MKSGYLVGTAFAAMIIVLGTAVLQHQQTASSQNTPVSSSATITSTTSYTMAEVEQHGSAQSCWTTINGNVYDLTNWIDQHPGGPQAILSLCGTDGTAAFEAQHGGQAQPAQELATFYIGTLSS